MRLAHAIACISLMWSPAAVAQPVSNIGPHRAPSRIIPGQYIVTLRDDVDPEAVARDRGVAVQRRFNRVFRGFSGRLTPEQRASLEADPRVRRVEPDREMVMSATTAWGLDRIDQRALPLNNLYTAAGSGAGVSVYVLDTGIRLNHVEFAGRALPGLDVIGDGQNGNDCNGHGTHVAGTIAGTTYGVARSVKVVSNRVLDCAGSGSSSGIISALDWVTINARRPAVINLSLGGGISLSLEDAVRRVIAAGITVIVAAGNEGADACLGSPARMPEVITIAATDRSDQKPAWSNWGNCVDLFAPGDSILSAYHTDGNALAYMSGTSMAAPHVAGAAALLLSQDPSLTPAGVRSTLLSSATPNIVLGGQSATRSLLYSGSATAAASPKSDFNGDGRSDIVWLRSDGMLQTWLGQSNGSFTQVANAAANALDSSWRIVGIGDFNGDRRDDILWRQDSGAIGQWLGQPNGTFVNNGVVAPNPVDSSWSVLGVADYNGDTRDDVLWRRTSGAITQWLGQSSGAFVNNSGAVANSVDSSWSVVANGDFNGDKRADVLWRHSTGAFAEWQGSATGTLVNVGAVMNGATGSVVGSGDFTGDGREDVLMRNASTGAITVWLAQANGQFTSFTPTRQLNDLGWKIAAIGDYNGDSKDDLLWRHVSGEGGEWLATGTGDFGYNGPIPTVATSWKIQSPAIFPI